MGGGAGNDTHPGGPTLPYQAHTTDHPPSSQGTWDLSEYVQEVSAFLRATVPSQLNRHGGNPFLKESDGGWKRGMFPADLEPHV